MQGDGVTNLPILRGHANTTMGRAGGRISVSMKVTGIFALAGRRVHESETPGTRAATVAPATERRQSMLVEEQNELSA